MRRYSTRLYTCLYPFITQRYFLVSLGLRIHAGEDYIIVSFHLKKFGSLLLDLIEGTRVTHIPQ